MCKDRIHRSIIDYWKTYCNILPVPIFYKPDTEVNMLRVGPFAHNRIMHELVALGLDVYAAQYQSGVFDAAFGRGPQRTSFYYRKGYQRGLRGCDLICTWWFNRRVV